MGIHTLLAVVSALPALLTHWCRGTTLSCTSWSWTPCSAPSHE